MTKIQLEIKQKSPKEVKLTATFGDFEYSFLGYEITPLLL